MEDDKALGEIRKIAYRLWIEDGRPEGEDRRHWDRAKEIWAFEHAGEEPAATETKPKPSATPSRRRGGRSLPAAGLGG
ncbi:MAG: DUF2934 domain-containing protein [Bosea sp. (in: a-proteobacteria)]|uniref:DUF2934 domain-containing protein n=1 Tax=Bosea sp. (in: a-proteobacteria) TaxID=1871050 RepID=UPI002733F9B1|nr:DUF2934 domain-containing protein [Bosea sp. (in: a-proteobacteria)]MDP3254660.1 DUF2934 domain-containing protein [Bosea sp. (in: a-proteobacteria)]MDP3317529.1 DUF2934 domain-containing protein [Bosea sp. (in: a-proteobacteria)]